MKTENKIKEQLKSLESDLKTSFLFQNDLKLCINLLCWVLDKDQRYNE